MKDRLSHKKILGELARHTAADEIFSGEMSTRYFKCLNGKDVIAAKVSDHHPIIHDGVLFWNIMMQGKARIGRTKTSYNNGFGFIESDERYINRLVKIADVLAETMYHNPSINVISLCEGPIQPLHIDILIHSLKKHLSMNKFFLKSVEKDDFYKPNIEGFANWGLLMLADHKYKISAVKCEFMDHSTIFNKLANRFQIWELINHLGVSKYVALGHFPFGGDERITEKQKLSAHGNMYCSLVRNVMNHYSNDEFILCADFNLNPNLISECNDRALDLIANNNSIIQTTAERSNEMIIDAVTVDGILLSTREKQKYHSSRFNFGLFTRLDTENNMCQSNIKDLIIHNRHENPNSQRIYDKQYGVALR